MTDEQTHRCPGLVAVAGMLAVLCMVTVGVVGCRRGMVQPRPQTQPAGVPEPAKAPRGIEGQPRQRLLIAPEDCEAPPPDAVTIDDAVADLQVVEEVLRNGYAGYEAVAAKGYDWEQAFESARTRLQQLGTHVALEEFRALLLAAFEGTRDGHLAFWTLGRDGGWGSTGVHMDAYTPATRVTHKAGKLYLDGAEIIACPGLELSELVRPTFTTAPSSLMVRLSEDQPAPLQCRVRAARGEEVKTLAFRPLDLPSPKQRGDEIFSETPGEIPIVRVSGFDPGKHEQMTAFANAAQRLRDEPVLVVDLRGNPGGSDNYARDFFLNLTSGTLRYHVIEELHSETTLEGTLNWFTCLLARSDLDATGREAHERTRQQVVAQLEGATHGKSWRVQHPKHEGKAARPYDGTLVVLVDRGCASACESFVMYARQLPTSLVVGENTAGAGIFGEARRYRLPRSGIWMQAGVKWFRDPDPVKAAKEGHGYEPDIWLDSRAPVAVALDIARCVKKKKCSARLRSQLQSHKGRVTRNRFAKNPRAHVVLEEGVTESRKATVNKAFVIGYERLLSMTESKPLPLTLRIYATRRPFFEDLRRISGLDDTSGFSTSGAPRPLDGQFYVPPDLSAQTVCHELAHAFLDAIWGRAYRRAKWLDEGFAGYFARRYCHDPDGDRWLPLDAALWPKPVGDLVALFEMTTEEQWGALRRSSAQATYTQAELVVRWMVETYGEQKILAVIRSLSRMDLEAALQAELGVSVSDVDEEVRALYGRDEGNTVK